MYRKVATIQFMRNIWMQQYFWLIVNLVIFIMFLLLKVCDDRHSELIPCLDRHLIYQLRMKLDLSVMEHYERHCPPAERRYNCLIPPPAGYKVKLYQELMLFEYKIMSWYYVRISKLIPLDQFLILEHLRLSPRIKFYIFLNYYHDFFSYVLIYSRLGILLE